MGTNFLPSKYLKCKFGGVNSADGAGKYVEDDVSHIVGMGGLDIVSIVFPFQVLNLSCFCT